MKIAFLTFIASLLVMKSLNAQIPETAIAISHDDSVDLFSRDIFNNDFVTASVEFQGKKWEDVDLRFKGRSNRFFPKKSFRIKFPNNDLFYGKHQINLHSLYTDKSFLREKLSWMLFDDLEMLAPRSEYTRLSVNNHQKGLYLVVDRLDKYFLQQRGRPSSSLYSVDDEYSLGDLTEQPEDLLKLYYEKHVGDNSDYDDLKSLLRVLNTTPDSLFEGVVGQLFDVHSVYGWLTANILMMMGDSYNKNYYLFHDVSRAPSQWVIIPWDYDLSFGLSGDPAMQSIDKSLLNDGFSYTFPPLMGPHNVLKDRLWNAPAMREQLRHNVDSVLKTVFTEDRLHRRIDSLAAFIRPEVERDPEKRGTVQDFNDHIEALKYYVTARRNYLLKTFVHQPSGQFNTVTISPKELHVPYCCVAVDGRQLATMWFSAIDGLDSILVIVHPDALPPSVSTSDSGLFVKRWLQIKAFPQDAKFTAEIVWMYHDLSSTDREVPSTLRDERNLRCVWFNGVTWEQLPSVINSVSNVISADSISEKYCRQGMYFAIKYP